MLFFCKQQVPRVYNQNKYIKFQILSLYTEFTFPKDTCSKCNCRGGSFSFKKLVYILCLKKKLCSEWKVDFNFVEKLHSDSLKIAHRIIMLQRKNYNSFTIPFNAEMKDKTIVRKNELGHLG